MTKPREARGFTLIELMTVVAIVGILASVAIPAFQKLLLRAKVTERATITLRIKQQIQDYYLRNGALLPPAYGGVLVSGYNPPFPPSAYKRMMSNAIAPWGVYFPGPGGVLNEIEGALYYSYAFQVQEVMGAPSTIEVWSAGDLDADAAYSYKIKMWQGSSGNYDLVLEFPAEGEEDDHGPYMTF